MKKIGRLSVLIPLAVMFAAATFAQDSAGAKSALYKNFLDAYNRCQEIQKSDPTLEKPGNKVACYQDAKEAYQYATEYLQKYPNDAGQIPDFLKNYVEAFRKDERKNQLVLLFNDRKYDEGFALGRQILNDEPDDLFTLYILAKMGLVDALSGSDTNNAATEQYARKAIKLVQSGGGLPGLPKDETMGALNYALGLSSLENTPSDAVNAFIQVATLPNSARTDPHVYHLLAVAYQAAEYDKPAQEYKKQCTTPEPIASPTCKAMIGRLNLVVDRVIDAYARAVSLSGSKPNYANDRADWMKRLTGFYKYRNDGSEAGLSELIATVLSKPLPTGRVAPSPKTHSSRALDSVLLNYISGST